MSSTPLQAPLRARPVTSPVLPKADKVPNFSSLLGALANQPQEVETKAAAQPASRPATQEQLSQQLSLARPAANSTTARPKTASSWGFAGNAGARMFGGPAPAHVPPLPPERQAVQDALEEGGPSAAAAELNAQTANMDPAQAAKFLEDSRGVVSQITNQLGEDSWKASMPGMHPHLPSPEQAEFDQAVADLAAVVERASQAPDPQGREAVKVVTDSLLANIDPDDMGRFDEALGKTISAGSGAALAVAVADELVQAGRTEQGEWVVQEMERGTYALNERYDAVADKVDGHNAMLGRLLSDWAGMPEEDLQRAVQAYKDSHPEYAELEAMAGSVVATADQLSQLPPALAALEDAGDLQHANEHLIREQVVRVGNTESGLAAMATVQAQHRSGQADLVTHIEQLSASGELSAEERDGLASVSLNAASQRALASNDPTQALAVLNDMSATFGLQPQDMKKLTDGLGDIWVRRAAAGGPAEALTNLSDQLKELADAGKISPRLFHSLKGTGLGLGVLATYGDITKAAKDPNFENVAKALLSAGDAGTEGVAFLNLFKDIKLTQNPAFKAAGKLLGGLGAGMDVYSAMKSFADGDLPEAGLHALSAAGGIAMLAGGAWTGPGVIVAIGAALALHQLDKVRAANAPETKHTQAFLEALGASSDVSYHLRDADSDGRSVGPVLRALAGHIGVEFDELFDWVISLPKGEVLDIVHAMHGVDPNGKGEFPLTAEHDATAGKDGVLPAFRDPRSLTGLVTWLERNGYEVPRG